MEMQGHWSTPTGAIPIEANSFNRASSHPHSMRVDRLSFIPYTFTMR